MMILANIPFNNRHVQIDLKVVLTEIGHSVPKLWTMRVFVQKDLSRVLQNKLKRATKSFWTFCLTSINLTHSSKFYPLGKMNSIGIMLFCSQRWHFHPPTNVLKQVQVIALRHRHARSLVVIWCRFLKYRAQIFKKVGVKFCYIFLWIKVLDRNFERFAVNLPWQLFDIFVSFKVAVCIDFEIMTSSNF